MLDISRVAFNFVDQIKRESDCSVVVDRCGRELFQHGLHAWLMTGPPNGGIRIDSLMMLNGRRWGRTKHYSERTLVQNDAVLAHCFHSTAPFEWPETPLDQRARSACPTCTTAGGLWPC
jgi:hypothetical protein